MEEKQFLENFSSIFDEVEANQLTMETKFKNIGEWSSLSALGLLAVMDEEYGVELNYNDINNSETVRDIFDIIKNK
ncbi:MAG: acyl carrier protein [Bergeyella sp.]|nr:acyl carrier protein [Bergeyella sp.]